MANKSKYETDVKSKFGEIKKWLEIGATEQEIAKNLGIAKSTFCNYKKKYTELSDFIRENRKKPVIEIKSAMLKRALGFEYIETKTVKQKIDLPEELAIILEQYGVDTSKLKKPYVVRIEETKKQALPSETAGLILLKHWDKDENGKAKWTGDPASLEIKQEELKLKKEQMENDW